MRPTKEELNKKVWYRCFKVVAIVLIVFSFFTPYFVHRKANLGMILDGGINVVIWLLIVLVLRAIIFYILYGKKDVIKEEKSEKIKNIMQWILWGGGFTIFIGCLFYFLLVSSRNF